MHCLPHHHARQVLGSGHDDNAGERYRLHHGEGNVRRSRREVNEEIVQLAPYHVVPELHDRLGEQRAPPDHGIVLLRQEQINRHDLDPGPCFHRQDGLVAARGTRRKAKHLGNTGAGDISIQDAHLTALAAQGNAEQTGYQ